MDFSLLSMCFCYSTLVLSSILAIFMDNQVLAVPGAFRGFEFHLLRVIPSWSKNKYASFVGPLHYEAQMRQHDRGVSLSSVGSSLLVSALLSLGITAMLPVDGGDRLWEQLLRSFISYQGTWLESSKSEVHFLNKAKKEKPRAPEVLWNHLGKGGYWGNRCRAEYRIQISGFGSWSVWVL